MKIRRIRPRDYAAVDRLLMQLHQLDVAGRPELFFPIPEYMSRDAFLALVRNPSVICLLAQERGEIVGCCFASTLGRSGMAAMQTVYIDLLVVEERYRRRGIGRALFQRVVELARSAGAARVDLMVWNHNPNAIRAYESYGMRPQRTVYEIRL